jgi:2Fe-2S ferredoxin
LQGLSRETRAVVIVHIDGSDVDLEVNQGESVAEAAWRQGYTWPTKCYGQMECMQCFVRVQPGLGELNVVPAGEDELLAMRTLFPAKMRTSMVRLGCRIEVKGEGVVLEKKGVVAPPVVSDGEDSVGSAPAP